MPGCGRPLSMRSASCDARPLRRVRYVSASAQALPAAVRLAILLPCFATPAGDAICRSLRCRRQNKGGRRPKPRGHPAHGGCVAAKHHDLVNHTKRLKADAYEFYLDLTSWRKFTSAAQLDWQKLRFGNAAVPNVPRSAASMPSRSNSIRRNSPPTDTSSTSASRGTHRMPTCESASTSTWPN